MSKYILVLLSFFYSEITFAQNSIRYKNDILYQIDSVIDIKYGTAINIKNNKESLLANLFSPTNDTVKYKPLVLFVHGGGFQNGDKSGGYINLSRNYFVKKGFAFASINYRVGIEEPKTNQQYFEALFRASSDVETAIIYFKNHADEYKIDTSNIFLMGSSAGAESILATVLMPSNFITESMQHEFWGNTSFSSNQLSILPNIRGVISCWGATPTYKWIQSAAPPLFFVHGMADKTVPYDSSFSHHGFNNGSLILYHQAVKLGVLAGMRLFTATGHTLDNSSVKQDSALKEINAWIYARILFPRDSFNATRSGVAKWQNDIKDFAKDSLRNTYTKNAVLVTGSSFIRYWVTIKKDLAPFEIIHRGYGGCNLTDMAYYINDILDNYPLKALMIYVGNDIVVSRKDKTPLQVLELYKYIVDQVRTKHPDIPIIWAAICPSVKRWAVWKEIQEANQLIKEYCTANKNLFVIESPEVFFKKNAAEPDPRLYRDDNLHFNTLGYEKWTSVIQPALLKILK